MPWRAGAWDEVAETMRGSGPLGCGEEIDMMEILSGRNDGKMYRKAN
jgi:hypothetical protein